MLEGHEKYANGIDKLREQTIKSFRNYQKLESQFYQNLRLWLLAAPLLEDESPEIVDEICDKVKEKIATGQIKTNIADTISKITRSKVMQSRRKRGKEFDPALIDKLPISTPEGFEAGELSQDCMKQLSPIHRLLISLSHRGVKKTAMAKMLFVTPARITQYFREAEKEIRDRGDIEK